MNILVVSNNYPSNHAPGQGAFVYNLVQEFARYNNVTVIAPEKSGRKLYKKEKSRYGDELCQVFRPSYPSFSNKKILGYNTIKLTRHFFKKAIFDVVDRLNMKPDIIYCHFLSNAAPMLEFAEKNDIPMVVASGESTYSDWQTQPTAVQKKAKQVISHIICVSESNLKKLIAQGFDANKMTLVPNAVNTNAFKPANKLECKKALGYGDKDFVIGFVGHFIERKGPNRVIQAIKNINDPAIKLVCVGGGGKLEDSSFTQELPPMPNRKLPEIFNAFDLFVLPTLNEGHCNVVEEAKACAVPVVSSKGTSVELQLNSGQGILIDPTNVGEIAAAIKDVFENRDKLKIMEARLKNEEPYSISSRADIVLTILKGLA